MVIKHNGGQALGVSADVSQPHDVQWLIDSALNRFGAIDVPYNNAASFHAFGGIWEVDAEHWWRDVTINLRGPMLCCQAVLRHMLPRNSGIIINMNGGGAVVPLAGGSGYGCSKAALLRLTDTLAAELTRIKSAVMVFSLGPGLVRTEATELQTVDPLALKWIGSTAEAFAKGQTRPPGKARASGRQTAPAVACPELSGRVFEVSTDFAGSCPGGAGDQNSRYADPAPAQTARVSLWGGISGVVTTCA